MPQAAPIIATAALTGLGAAVKFGIVTGLLVGLGPTGLGTIIDGKVKE